MQLGKRKQKTTAGQFKPINSNKTCINPPEQLVLHRPRVKYTLEMQQGNAGGITGRKESPQTSGVKEFQESRWFERLPTAMRIL